MLHRLLFSAASSTVRSMLVKRLVLTARDSFKRSDMPAQIRARDTRLAFTEILGDESLKGQLLPTGPILQLMDTLAATISGRASYSPVATIAFDRVDLVRPVFHGDLVRVEGEVIRMGSSSMAIHVCGFRHDLQTNKFQHTHSGIVTMVAIDPSGEPREGLPELYDEDDAEQCMTMQIAAQQRLALASRWQNVQEHVDRMDLIHASEIQMLVDDKATRVGVRDTELELRKWFLPKNLNVNLTLFGGDLLTWMDKAALYCARNFVQNEKMVTIAMNRVAFKQPILATDVVTLHARVVNVQRFRLEVEVEVFVTSVGETAARKSHTGYFTVMNMDADNQLQAITRGLEVDESDQDAMKMLLKAQKRWEFEDEDAALMRLEPLSLSLERATVDKQAATHPCIGLQKPLEQAAA